MTRECAGSVANPILNKLCLHYTNSGAAYQMRANKRKVMDMAYLFQYKRLVFPWLVTRRDRVKG